MRMPITGKKLENISHWRYSNNYTGFQEVPIDLKWNLSHLFTLIWTADFSGVFTSPDQLLEIAFWSLFATYCGAQFCNFPSRFLFCSFCALFSQLPELSVCESSSSLFIRWLLWWFWLQLQPCSVTEGCSLAVAHSRVFRSLVLLLSLLICLS